MDPCLDLRGTFYDDLKYNCSQLTASFQKRALQGMITMAVKFKIAEVSTKLPRYFFIVAIYTYYMYKA